MKLLKILILAITLVTGMLTMTVLANDIPAKKTPVLIDVRTEDEWNTGHLEGAILIPQERIGEDISKFVSDKSSKIQLYCRTGRRSGLALDILKQAGYENVINLGSKENAAQELGRQIIK